MAKITITIIKTPKAERQNRVFWALDDVLQYFYGEFERLDYPIDGYFQDDRPIINPYALCRHLEKAAGYAFVGAHIRHTEQSD
jgi:hypothetical protein